MVDSIRIVEALDFPKPKWNTERKIFTSATNKGSLHGDAAAKGNMIKDRYQLILQRVKRSQLFTDVRQEFQLTTVDALIGSPGTKQVFGYLSQLQEGRYYLEDPKGNVPLDLSNCKFSAGIFVEGALVMAAGEYSDADGIFKVSVIGFPLAESRADSKRFLGNLDLFVPPMMDDKGHATGSISSKYPMFRVSTEDEAMEVDMPAAEFVVLSDVHVDKPQVLEKLKKMLEEFQEDPPAVIVMLGNFCSSPGSRAENVSLLKAGLDKLADVILSFPRIAHESRFVFVPGPTDPGGCVVNILPNEPLPSVFTKSLQEKLSHCHIASNPCRIRFYKQDIVIFREDLVNKMKRYALRNPEDDESINNITQHLVKTICDQSHLCPISSRAVYWNYDHTLSLFPLPDTIILADRFDQFEHHYDNCYIFNPGSFTTDFSFVIYKPKERATDFARIDV